MHIKSPMKDFKLTSLLALTVGAMLLSSISRADDEPESVESIEQRFPACIAELKQQARDKGVSKKTVDRVLDEAEFLPKVIELDRRQPEFTSTFERYLNIRVSDTRLEKGREMYQKHRLLLQRLSREYGVPGRYLVSFWGLETNYGGYMGKMQAPSALATLSCDKRRSSFFSRELVTVLQLADAHGFDAAKMEGSWAGALGHTQFMPSTYQRYAVDGDGDGVIDLWGSLVDALASAANFLQQLGWERGLRWGREVILPADFDWSQAGRKNSKPVSAWAAMGVRRADGRPLPNIDDIDGAIIVPAGHDGPAFLAYQNFKVIMGWNRSEYYAISVGHLADRIAGGSALVRQPPKNAPRLSRAHGKAIQEKLNEMGFDAGKPDGIIGGGTRAAIARYQASRGWIADGFTSRKLVEALLGPDFDKNSES